MRNYNRRDRGIWSLERGESVILKKGVDVIKIEKKV